MSLAHAFGRLAFATALTCLAAHSFAGVSVRTSSTDPAATPFPSDRFSVRDWHNNTFRRVNLPKPDCTLDAARALECADIDVINELDGFSTQPRITIPFTGAIDPASVNSDTVYLVNLGDTLSLRGFGDRVGINQVVWDPATNTLVLQPDELLQQHSRYAAGGDQRRARCPRQPHRRRALDDNRRGRTLSTTETCATACAGAGTATAWWRRACSPRRASPPICTRSATRSSAPRRRR